MIRCLILALVVLGACKKKEKAAPATEPVVASPPNDPWSGGEVAPRIDEPEPNDMTMPRPLPPRDPDGTVGVGLLDEALVIEAAEDGGWVALCVDTMRNPNARLVVGDGAAILIDRLIATSRRDIVYAAGGQLHHVDVEARTVRVLGPVASAAIDGASRRIVFAKGDKLVVLDPGSPPREIAAGAPVSAVWLQHRRVATFASGPTPDALSRADCSRGGDTGSYNVERIGVDLDPTGVEAIERIGPELGVTATGEITVDGEVMIDAACGAHVVAAIASPPRVLAQCRKGDDVVVGPGFKKKVSGYFGQIPGTGASIADYLLLGRRLVCPGGHSTCVDLLTGQAHPSDNRIYVGDTVIVTGDDADLKIVHVPATADLAARTLDVSLPRAVRTVTVDAVTGRRITGPAPEPPHLVGVAGRWMLYGRHIIDLQDGVRVTTLAENALAIDETGRVLAPVTPGKPQLRWRKP